MKKIAVVGTRGGWSTERLADAVQDLTGYRQIVEMDEVRLDLPSGALIHDDRDLGQHDALIIKKIGGTYSRDMTGRLEMLRLLSERGMKIYSDPLRIMRVIDRLGCTVTLQAGGIPMPPTTITEDTEQALWALRKYGRAVFKPLYSTKARGMLQLTYGEGSRAEIDAFKESNGIMYIQKSIELPGQDLGVVFLGGRYLTTYARRMNAGSWTSSTAFGGSYVPYEPGADIIGLAAKAQSLFGLDFTCVDVVETGEGPMVFEVSAFGGFRGIYKTSGMDAARKYAEYVLGEIKG